MSVCVCVCVCVCVSAHTQPSSTALKDDISSLLEAVQNSGAQLESLLDSLEEQVFLRNEVHLIEAATASGNVNVGYKLGHVTLIVMSCCVSCDPEFYVM